MREQENLATWQAHHNKAMDDDALRSRQDDRLHPSLDFVDTPILPLAEFSPRFPASWPDFDTVCGCDRSFIEQRIFDMRPDQPAAHHAFYRDHIMPTLNREGASLIAFFDTDIGLGTTNASSDRSVELRRFPDLESWQRWRYIQNTDTQVSKLLKPEWLNSVGCIDSAILYPMDYS